MKGNFNHFRTYLIKFSDLDPYFVDMPVPLLFTLISMK
jgi:hypothetical protein